MDLFNDRFDKYRDEKGRIDLLSLYEDSYGERPHGYSYDMLEELMCDPGVVSRQSAMIAVKSAHGFTVLQNMRGDWKQW